MGMADEARAREAAAEAVRERAKATEDARRRLEREWFDAVGACVREFLDAAREMRPVPDRSRLWLKTWVVAVPIGTKNWTSEYDSGPSTQQVAIHSDGTWELVWAYFRGSRKTLTIEKQDASVPVSLDDPVPFEDIRARFVGRLART